jgi:malate dehydrogenase
MAVIIENSKTYGLPEKVCFSLPCVCEDGKFKVVEGLKWDAFSKSMIDKTLNVTQPITKLFRNSSKKKPWHLKD